MRPTLRQLEYVVALCETLNFRKAAERCCVSQPSLSAQLQEIERVLGVRLFERDKRKVLLTAAGEAFAGAARRIIMDVDDLVQATANHRNPFAGTLRLGVIPTVAPYMLPAALPALRRQWPRLRLLLCEEQTHGLVERAARGDLDLLLLALEADLGPLESLALFTDPLVAVFSENHPLARSKRLRQADLAGQEVLVLGEGNCLRDQALSVCEAAGARGLPQVRAMSLPTVVQMARSGVGITLLPSLAITAELRGKKGLAWREFVEPRPARTVGLAWRKSSPHKEAFVRLGNLLRQIPGRFKQ
jgi:LysR family hydrogen peroxide-inducible transcriptional activator